MSNSPTIRGDLELSQAPRDEVPLAGVLVSMVPFGTAIFAYLVSTFGCPVVRDLGFGVNSTILSSCLAGWAAIAVSVASGISAEAVVVSGVHRNLRHQVLKLAGIGSLVCLFLMILVVSQFAEVMQYGDLLLNNPIFQQMAGVSAEEADKFVRLSIQTGYNAVYGAVFAGLSAIGLFWYNSSRKTESESNVPVAPAPLPHPREENHKRHEPAEDTGPYDVQARYVQHLANLEKLRARGKISENFYRKFKDEYQKKLAEVAPSPLAPSGAEPTTGEFCMDCGASLPAHATFCNKCGSKQ